MGAIHMKCSSWFETMHNWAMCNGAMHNWAMHNGTILVKYHNGFGAILMRRRSWFGARQLELCKCIYVYRTRHMELCFWSNAMHLELSTLDAWFQIGLFGVYSCTGFRIELLESGGRSILMSYHSNWEDIDAGSILKFEVYRCWMLIYGVKLIEAGSIDRYLLTLETIWCGKL